MAGYFLDSSALVKRYVQEAGTAWIRGVTRRGTAHQIYVSRITAVEVTAAVARRRKGGSIPSRQASSVLSRFRKHLAGRYTILEVTPSILAEAMKLANTQSLRAYDAVQLTTAIELNNRWVGVGLGGIVLVSADRELNAAASAKGLAVEDPTAYP
ncbi:type II toxin-antitoxin system VapC family toxin [Paludisphaera rhizosphaerae]|uniref:type II toxin-antitoxin system VapC family toxin n=1 Tax=Paludisphaera rhizosphaerae TaxID=2711216 RepID=UPI001F10C8E0|nr:type II toxin-antitoxin system VapC family toxin [Paludisphaera rhizosphaerae]